MAHERKKLAEAHYFYSQMLREINDREKFSYNLSAFLTAARSVLQYALKEASTRNGGKQWYHNHITASSVLSFFRLKRNFNIHTAPVTALQHTDLTVQSSVIFTGATSFVHLDGDGNVLDASPPAQSKPEPISKQPEPPAEVKNYYTFPDWEGKEDVVTLCKTYLEDLQRVIQDGIQRGFLTGR